MKTLMTIAAVTVFTLAFGLAYADEISTASQDVGTDLYLSAFPIGDVVAVKDFSTGIHPSEDPLDVGTALYNDFLNRDTMMAGSEAQGSAAGGMAKEDEITTIWEHSLGAPGGSDLP